MKTKPTYEELEKRVRELERRVNELEAQPREQHFHYHPPIYQQPYVPTYVPPSSPAPEPYKIGISDQIPNPWQTTTVTWPSTGIRRQLCQCH